MRGYGVEDTDAALDSLFDSIDLDKGGTLDPKELRAAWQKLKDEATAMAEARDQVNARVARLRKQGDPPLPPAQETVAVA